jgi:ATP-dependent DNA helicase RecQ
MKIQGRPNPFLKEIRGDGVVSRNCTGRAGGSEFPDLRYEIVGLNEMYMDFAGGFHKEHDIHRRLAALEAGKAVFFHRSGKRIEIHDADGGCVARLSEEGAAKWLPRLEQIRELRVVALLRRDRDDPSEEFQRRIRAERWELPVLEAVFVPGEK